MAIPWQPNMSLPSLRTLAITLLIAFLPTQLGTYFFMDFSFLSGIRTDFLAPALFLTDLLAIAVIVLNSDVVIQTLRNKRILAAGGIVLVSVFVALSPGIAWYKFAKALEWLCLVAVFYARPPSAKIVIASLLAGAFLEFGLVLLQLQAKQAIQGVFYYFGERMMTVTTPDVAIATLGNGPVFLRPYGTFSHPNSLGGFYAVAYFFTLLWPPFKRYPRWRAAVLTLAAGLTLVSFSKTAVIAFGVGNLILYFRTFLDTTCRWCAIVRGVVLVVVVFVFATTKGDPATIAKRLELIGNAWQIIRDHPLAGVGPGNYLIAQAAYTSKFPMYFSQPVHNIVLLYFAELGLEVGGALIALAYKPLTFLVRNESFRYVFGIVLLTGMMDHYWLTLQQNILLTAVFAGLICSVVFPIMGRLPVDTLPSQRTPPPSKR